MSTAERNRQVGSYGERLAAARLEELGLVVLDRNWRCPAGELDLVLRDGEVLVFCEVKTRTDATRGHPLEAVGPVKAAGSTPAARLAKSTSMATRASHPSALSPRLTARSSVRSCPPKGACWPRWRAVAQCRGSPGSQYLGSGSGGAPGAASARLAANQR